MTIEEIIARWKAATPGPWTFDAGRGGIASGVIDVINTDDGFVSISDEDAKAIAAAPTDIAYLLDRVRELAGDNRSLRDRLRDEFSAHNESIVRVLDDLAKYKRAHAWLVENTSAHICAHQLPSGCNSCIDRDCDARVCIEPHDPMCEWVKARDLTL